ncbi:hypothetical protein AVL50_01025 [Flammeovirga sp. SJP92]|nr:hypothetical protein AVL50_01025 [Flammeovirga sp. SJP92]
MLFTLLSCKSKVVSTENNRFEECFFVPVEATTHDNLINNGFIKNEDYNIYLKQKGDTKNTWQITAYPFYTSNDSVYIKKERLISLYGNPEHIIDSLLDKKFLKEKASVNYDSISGKYFITNLKNQIFVCEYFNEKTVHISFKY